jgi:hypothetical protein
LAAEAKTKDVITAEGEALGKYFITSRRAAFPEVYKYCFCNRKPLVNSSSHRFALMMNRHQNTGKEKSELFEN